MIEMIETAMGLIVLFGIPALAFVGARWISKNLD
jgi:hypothetical protein